MKTLLAACLIIFLIPASAFPESLLEDSIIGRIWKQNMVYPREKVYAVTDKPVYVPGDTIWFRSFVVEAATFKDTVASRYAYAELVSPANTLQKRVKITKNKNGVFSGYIAVPHQANPGKYTLRCYTRYSQNFDGKGVFCRSIDVLSNRKKELDGEKTTNNNFHVGFYPEGGLLVAGQLCRVAFKVETEDGSDVDMDGFIVDEEKDTICRFSSFHQGMGDFSFIPQEGTKYYAECSTKEGGKKSFLLPAAGKNTCTLKAERVKGNILLSVVKGEKFPDGAMYLLGVSHELPVFSGIMEQGKSISFPDTLFKNGIVHFYLLKDRTVVSKRSVFVLRRNKTTIGLNKLPDHTFKRRERVELELMLTGTGKTPLGGSAALAVTDASDILPDSLQTIVSELLLSSDLKGTIEDPAWYFRTNDTKKADYALDVLMRIHAWCRYDLLAILKTDYDIPCILPETSMAVKGKVVTRVKGNPVENAAVNMYVKDYQDIRTTMTDKDGVFSFDGFEYPDSTVYMLSAVKQNGATNIVLEVDTVEYPLLKGGRVENAGMLQANNNIVSVHYLDKAIKNISTDGDTRNYLLGDITVTARKQRNYLTRYEIAADNVLKEDDIQQSGNQELLNLISSQTGVNFYTFRGGMSGEGNLSGNRVLVLDDVKIEDKETIDWILKGGIRKEDVQQIEIIKGLKCAGYFTGNCDLIVSITTKRGGKGADYTDTNFAYFAPLGLQRPKEFYSPHYEENQSGQPDLRSTIYWQPDVTFKNGKANVSFYTADTPSAYTVLVEGIAGNGEPFRLETVVFR